jgi:hypothetical protein
MVDVVDGANVGDFGREKGTLVDATVGAFDRAVVGTFIGSDGAFVGADVGASIGADISVFVPAY